MSWGRSGKRSDDMGSVTLPFFSLRNFLRGSGGLCSTLQDRKAALCSRPNILEASRICGAVIILIMIHGRQRHGVSEEVPGARHVPVIGPLELMDYAPGGRNTELELLNDKYSGTAQSYRWRCLAAGHDICRTKGNIEQSLRKQLPACDVCAAEKVGSKAGGRERDKADEFAQRLIPLIDEIRTAGTTSLTGIANELNGRSIRTSLGRRWYASTVKNLLTRLSSGRDQN
jgi:hypothetical protein